MADMGIKNIKVSFWDTLFKEDVVRQAGFVEAAGWFGFVLLLCLVVVLSPAQRVVTVPVSSAQLVLTETSAWGVVAQLDQIYFSQVHVGQVAQVELRADKGKSIKVSGNVTSIDLQPGQGGGKISIALPAQPVMVDLIDPLTISARVVTGQRSWTNLFLGEKRIIDFVL